MSVFARAKKIMLLQSAAAFIFGALILLLKTDYRRVMVQILGGTLAAGGIAMVAFFYLRKRRSFWLSSGIVYTAFGIYLFINAKTFLRVLPICSGIILFLFGALRIELIATELRAPAPVRALCYIAAALMMLIGISLSANSYPGNATTMTGIFLILDAACGGGLFYALLRCADKSA